jgi:hypothetical protein
MSTVPILGLCQRPSLDAILKHDIYEIAHTEREREREISTTTIWSNVPVGAIDTLWALLTKCHTLNLKPSPLMEVMSCYPLTSSAPNSESKTWIYNVRNSEQDWQRICLEFQLLKREKICVNPSLFTPPRVQECTRTLPVAHVAHTSNL